MPAIGISPSKTALGAVAVRNSSHFGAARATMPTVPREHGLIGIALTNAVARDRANRRNRGAARHESRLASRFRVPGADPIIVRYGNQRWSRVRASATLLAAGQKTIPEGWALDPSGRPTIDPAVAVKGSLLPIGGPKGYALVADRSRLLCSALSDGEPRLPGDLREHGQAAQQRFANSFWCSIRMALPAAERYGKRA